MFKRVRIILLLSIFGSLVVGCKSSQILSYKVLLRKVPLETEIHSNKAPKIIVVTSKDEIISPVKGIKYPKVVEDLLTDLDYRKSFAIIFLVGQVQEDYIIKEIIREKSNVTIRLNEYSIGPGNYEVPGLTLPFQLIVIEKSGIWEEMIHFEIMVNQSDRIAETDHYVP